MLEVQSCDGILAKNMPTVLLLQQMMMMISYSNINFRCPFSQKMFEMKEHEDDYNESMTADDGDEVSNYVCPICEIKFET